MTAEEREFRQQVEAKATRMYSAAMYRRLKRVVDGWAQEDRLRRRVAAFTLAGLGLSALALVIFTAFLILARQ
jgi:hypothetical protein